MAKPKGGKREGAGRKKTTDLSVQIKCAEAEKQTWFSAAQGNFSAWARDALNRKAKDENC